MRMASQGVTIKLFIYIICMYRIFTKARRKSHKIRHHREGDAHFQSKIGL